MQFSGKLPDIGIRSKLLTTELMLGINLFFLHSEEKLKLLAELRWIETTADREDEYLMGVRFIDFDAETEKKLWRLIESVQRSGAFR